MFTPRNVRLRASSVFTQLYAEFNRRYKEPLGLEDLMGEFGGRPDYGQARSYTDGVPLIVWIFTDHDAFKEYHEKVKGGNISDFIAGYFSGATGWIYLYDEPGRDRVFEINKNVHEGTHQLEHWYTRQRNKWRIPPFAQDWFGEGLAEWIGCVKMDEARNLAFLGVNIVRLENMQQIAQGLKGQGKEYPIFPLAQLTGFNNYEEVKQWGTSTWGPPFTGDLVLSIFYQEAWAFAYFLNEAQGGKYQKNFNAYLKSVLSRDRGQENFKKAFGIIDEEDWTDLDNAFTKFVREDLMKRSVGQYQYMPPKVDQWPPK